MTSRSEPSPRPGIMSIKPYVGGASAVDGKTRVVKLASNEGAFGPSPKAVTAMTKAAEAMHRYPDGGSVALRDAIAKLHGLDADMIVCGAGSDELLSLLAQAYAGPGDEVIYSEHGFLMYPIAARAVGADPVSVPEKNLTADVDGILAAVTERTKIVFLANPNNPTGTYVDGDELARLHAGLPDNVILVLDAAYAEFVDTHDYDPGVQLVRTTANVVMTRTFSKLYALGGVRLGWAFCPKPIADVLNRVRGPFNVSAMAQVAGLAALKDRAHAEKTRTHTIDWRGRATQRLRGMGLELTDSQGNFVLARFPGGAPEADACDAFLKEAGIIVRRMGGYGLPDCLRISIGTAEEMETMMDAIERFLKEGGTP